MRTSHILLLCILGAALLTTVFCNNANGPEECCFKFYPRRVNKKLISSYNMNDYRCPRTGVILMTKKGRHICADPNLSWVQGIMKTLDEALL
ncbi:C-C motif chemokine 36.1 [Scomber japonicus]|uniref:C-C motif chemokine 36.1 n=1 Tax=Scomber japonicus TaxID=13676 RepID=UPI002305E0B3|nr:C-C motif chemokine 36.1 [Scomber japonicus]